MNVHQMKQEICDIGDRIYCGTRTHSSECVTWSRGFLGQCSNSRHETPGSKQFAETILPFVQDTNIVILANHGTVSFGKNVEEAYWCTEMLDPTVAF